MNELVRGMDDRILTESMGDCPNIVMDTWGGNYFWKDLGEDDGMRLQKHCISGHCRILDSQDRRIAWGSAAVMSEKFRRLTRESFLERGDIIGITRKHAMSLYDHYAVYLGDDQVIHYAGEDGDFVDNITIHQAHISEFLKKDTNYFVLHFEDNRHAPKKIFLRSELLCKNSVYLNEIIYSGNKEFTLYSPEETIERARSRLQEDHYNLVTNNCEHFALWCKMGVSKSFQVEQVVYNLTHNLDGRYIGVTDRSN